MTLLEIKNLTVKRENKEILKNINLTLEKGKVHVLIGPNGSGKSTLAHVIMGDPKYTITSGKIFLNNEDITNAKPNERAKKGLFLLFQNPISISGLSIFNFLKQAYQVLNKKISVLDFKELLEKKAEMLNIDKAFLGRYLNEGFSGGEKKKIEALQMILLNPTIAILDETDSGLDVDSFKIVLENIKKFMTPEKSILLITHYNKMFEYIKPDQISLIIEGKIVKQGDISLIKEIEEKGYTNIK